MKNQKTDDKRCFAGFIPTVLFASAITAILLGVLTGLTMLKEGNAGYAVLSWWAGFAIFSLLMTLDSIAEDIKRIAQRSEDQS